MRSSLRSSNIFRDRRPRRTRRLLSFALICLAAVYMAAQSQALDPHRAVSQYMIDRWGIDRGFPGGTVSAIAQSSDGYLWIGTGRGLVRFDGLNFRAFTQAGSVSFPIGPVRSLLMDSEGNLWILLESTKILRYRNGKFDAGHDEAEFGVTAMGRSNNGAALFSSLAYGTLTYDAGKFTVLQPPTGELADSSALSHSETGDTLSSRLSWATSVASHHLAEPNSAVISIAESTDGKVWLGTRDEGLFSIVDGRASSVPTRLPDRKITALLPLDGRKLWIGTDSGVLLWDGSQVTAAGIPSALRDTKVLAMLRDRDSNIWVGTTRGLYRFNSDGVAVSPENTTAASAPVTALFEDREGNLWAGTARGIERLRDSTFVTYPVGDSQSESSGPIYADDKGRVWFAPNEGGLCWLQNGKIHSVTDDGLARDIVYSIAGAGDELWIARQRGGLTRIVDRGSVLASKTYTQSDGLAQNGVYAVYRSADGAIWAATLNSGVSVFKNGRFTTYSKANGMSSDTVFSIAQSSDGTMWFATPTGLNAFLSGQWRLFTTRDGLPSDSVNALLPDAKGILWIGSASGLAFLSSGRIHRVVAPPFLQESILGIAQDGDPQHLWIATSNHILAATRSALLAGDPGPADVREYGLEDGLQGTEGVKRQPSVVADRFGRIWVSTNRGLSVVDTARIDNAAPAIIHIEELSADGNPVDFPQSARVPAGGRRLTLSYSGLSLSVPERVKFKYKLEGFDQNWSEPTTARQAVYTNLGPGNYRFHVMASNSDGMWNSAETVLPFKVEPAFWQTWWFRLCTVLVLALVVLAFFRLRVLRLTSQMKLRFEERLAERTRIAQELHDTLLQGVISASMQLHVVADQIPSDSKVRPTLDRILNLLTRVSEEGRNAVGGLRSHQQNSLDLGRAFSEVQHHFPNHEAVDFTVMVEGSPRSLHPIIRDEIFSIGREALTNAFRHSHADKIEVELEYAPSELRVLVRDNGLGFDSKLLRYGRAGHWGLSGMRERAKRIGAALRVLSRPSAGTEVELSIPGHIAFVPSPPNGTSKWVDKFLPGLKHSMERLPSEHQQ